MRHRASHEVHPPHPLPWRQIRERFREGLGEALRNHREVLLEDTLEEELRRRKNPPQQQNQRRHRLFDDRAKKCLHDLLDGWIGPGRVEHLQAPAVDRLDPPLDRGVDEAFLGLEMVVHSSKIYLGFRSDVAQGGGLEAILSKEFLCRIEDLGLGIYALNHTYVSIIRMIYTLCQDPAVDFFSEGCCNS